MHIYLLINCKLREGLEIKYTQEVNRWKCQIQNNYPSILPWVQCQKHVVDMDGVHIPQTNMK